MFGKVFEIVPHLVFPLYFMLIGLTYIPGTFGSLLLNGEFRILFSPSAFKDAWFSRFWAVYGTLIREGRTPAVTPLIHQAHGVVLDIGPGSGEWLSGFDKEKITKIYGVEPNVNHHPKLRERIRKAGLQDKYVIVPVGVEDLGDKWIKQGSVDSVVTVLCLCSIPTPDIMIGDLYKYMKEGGMWILFEHVKTKNAGWLMNYQSMVNIFWPHVLGGCSLTRDTERSLKKAGPWSKVDLSPPDDETPYAVVPHVQGILVK